ncbi:hypothetical protein NDU88_000564 [Pleurodeles waltl]|uniref:Uncharacterized protein n=1 Tax=Pleurodeles waltl TaxID=8319 RepID=A0AAV7KY53_PLEWA|nr:hypothetical protein NDU88_000564 [Pleurodeles waltl]
MERAPFEPAPRVGEAVGLAAHVSARLTREHICLARAWGAAAPWLGGERAPLCSPICKQCPLGNSSGGRAAGPRRDSLVIGGISPEARLLLAPRSCRNGKSEWGAEGGRSYYVTLQHQCLYAPSRASAHCSSPLGVPTAWTSYRAILRVPLGFRRCSTVFALLGP